MGEGEGVSEGLLEEMESLRARIRDFEVREAECNFVHTELSRARREWEGIFQGLAHPTVILDPRHVIIAANRAVVKASGKREGELVGRTCYEVFHSPGSTEPPRGCPMEKLLLSEGAETVEMEMEAFGGVYLVSCTSVFDDGGKLEKIIHIATDITERKRAEESLRESEERWRALFKEAADATFLADPETGLILDANAAAEKLMQRPRSELIGLHQSQLHPPDHEQQVKNNFRVHADTLTPVHTIEAEVLRADGMRLPVEILAGIIILGGQRVLQGTFRDITERKRVEEALRESEERYRIVADYSTDWDFWTAPDGSMVYVSPACWDITGYAPEEFYADPGLNGAIVHPDYREVLARHNQEAKFSDEKFSMELLIITKSGETRWIAHVCQAVFDSTGAPRGRRASNRDITALKRMEEENRRLHADLEQRVEERTAQLEAANRELESFSYSVSHDLRAPLRHIAGFTNILMEDCAEGLDEVAQDYLLRVVRATRRMEELVDALLKLSRYTRDEMVVEPVDLSEVAREIMAELTKGAPERRVTITIQEGLRAKGDAHLLRVAMENLLGNAWKYTGKVEEGVIEFGGEERAGRGVYFVRDNGAGFDMAYADKLFSAFRRLHGSDEFEGTGIGLATVRRIIHRHGGEVWADAAPNRGATFSFTLPLA